METKLEFVLPDERHRADVLGFYDEFRAQNETCIGYGGYENFDAWLTGTHRQSDPGTIVFSADPHAYRLCCPPLRILSVLRMMRQTKRGNIPFQERLYPDRFV